MFPINPTPFVLVYAFIVFFCPWCIYIICLIRELRFLINNDIIHFFNLDFFKMWRITKQFRKNNPEAKYFYRKVKIWFVITLVSWLIGFFLLAITLYILECNNLLVNHSKGMY